MTNVRYVLNLKNNLISFGTVEAKGFVVSMRDGILKVTSDALVVMKGTKRNNLYYFQCSIIIGMAATVFEEDVDSKTTRL